MGTSKFTRGASVFLEDRRLRSVPSQRLQHETVHEKGPWRIEPKRVGGSEISYRADVDGLRAIAVLAVVGFHASPRSIPGGFVGVDVFFVISGFLISSLIVNRLNEGNFSFLEFYGRRVRRLFPAFAIVLLTTLASPGSFCCQPSLPRWAGTRRQLRRSRPIS